MSHVLLGVVVLMWFAIYTVLLFFYNCIYTVFYTIGAIANASLAQFCKSFAAVGAFFGWLGTITLIVLQLSLRALYYIVVLWPIGIHAESALLVCPAQGLHPSGCILFWTKPSMRSF